MNRYYLLLSLMILNYCLTEDEYYTYDKIDSTLHAWQSDYGDSTHPIFPDQGIIYNLDTIGYSSQDSLPIFAVKLSDNVNDYEDEARVLILGQCHAEEIYGVEIAMEIIECYLNPEQCYNDYNDFGTLHEYLLDVLQKSLEKVELWVVPTHNPEGLRVVHGYCDDGNSATKTDCNINNGNWIEDSTYRKNIRDINNNNTFIEGIDYNSIVGYDEDGVDLNRNYDIHWIHGDPHLHNSSSSNSCYDDDYDKYRGSYPFSETEIQAVKNIALDKSFFLSIAYHSSRSGVIAEKIVFPWGWKDSGQSDSYRKESPDYSVIYILGEEIKNILSFGDDALKPQKSRTGNAHDWLYRETGCIQYLIEVGEFNYQGCYPGASGFMSINDEFLIDDKLNETIVENIEAFFYLLMNAIGEDITGAKDLKLSHLTGIVRNVEGNPIEDAIVRILEMDGLVLKPRITDEFGRFRRLLHPDSSYTLVVNAPGYIADTTTIESNELVTGINPQFDINLESQPSYQLKLNIQTPDNNTGEIQVIRQDSFSSDTAAVTNNIAWSLPEDYYQVTVTASGFSPTVIETLLHENKEYSIYLDTVQTIIDEDFIDLSQWAIQSGDWALDGEALSTQSELFYDNNVDWEIVSKNGIAAEVGDSLIIEIRLRYELEWEHDFFSMFYISESSTTELLHVTGDHYNFFTKYIPLEIKEGQANGKILFALNSDQNLNYRGVKIDKLVIHNGGNNTDNDLSNSFDLLPGNFVLHQNSPNPFNPITNIQFSVPKLSPVSISIYNLRGEFIEYLVNDVYEPGNYTMNLDAGSYSSGIYFYRLQTENSILARKFIIIK